MKYSSLESSQQDESNGSKITFLELIFDEKLKIWYKSKHVGFRRLNSFLNEICKITDKAKIPDILNGQDSYNEQVIGKKNNNIKIAKEVFYENQQNSLKKPF
ncbi:hypothetical protein GLOIN_2v1785820 [Rhizophagus irregularis DAOM 181602=DAOM 197198]|uniref:Uncharacterized protein n=1 Tax=Rhizophagus irregularis (strain DAOM 181602 / DAOM 197198 / MUCL 43194) TaxID=747089 RepID=A0A2P4P9M7_RHIID|nr:hypothetical protein GLOIN_2v1785820 [Rhizophagus irregularis DAOM 181602=DAOM 197198]POG62084.1 hypothetical protein GLOIN_2v1785820 [Rhizophagus irregularis DAOM 181602=DAOM 197198]GET52129.1 hypothetical protein GLOIN_2v1785820 [Rhizophagus irregularis DAOM 181602=DAOM 197198]|eukprot:XP_025168950.1 hypothetical protein GLOIN_2v1785820 [Rhizophagus irregularis DAOM 181602=DAOM 197198]